MHKTDLEDVMVECDQPELTKSNGNVRLHAEVVRTVIEDCTQTRRHLGGMASAWKEPETVPSAQLLKEVPVLPGQERTLEAEAA